MHNAENHFDPRSRVTQYESTVFPDVGELAGSLTVGRASPPAAPGAVAAGSTARLERYRGAATIAAEWDALADRTAGKVWVRPGWVEAWWRAFGRGQLEIVALRRAGQLVAVLPLGRRLGALTSVTNWHTPEFDAVGDPAAVAELLAMLMDTAPRRVSMAFVDASGGVALELRTRAEHLGFQVIVRPLEHSPYIRTDAGWAAYLAGRDGKMLRELRRRRRLLSAAGEMSFEVHDGRTRLAELFDEGFAVEAAGWKGAAGSAVASDAATLTFYRDIAHWAVSRGALRLGFLRLNGRAIAFDFSLEADGVHYLLKTGFDPSVSQFAPGKLLRYLMIERTFASGLDLYEFLGTDNPWKYAWTRTVRERSLIQVFSRSLPGRIDWAAFALGRPLVKRALAVAGR